MQRYLETVLSCNAAWSRLLGNSGIGLKGRLYHNDFSKHLPRQRASLCCDAVLAHPHEPLARLLCAAVGNPFVKPPGCQLQHASIPAWQQQMATSREVQGASRSWTREQGWHECPSQRALLSLLRPALQRGCAPTPTAQAGQHQLKPKQKIVGALLWRTNTPKI